MNYYVGKSPFRNLIVGVDLQIPLNNGKYTTNINFDNAATTPFFTKVLHDITNFSSLYSSVHRGEGYKSQFCSDFYENSRKIILDFFNSDSNYNTVIYVKNTTEAINKLAYRLSLKYEKCVVLSTQMEHHSNDLPFRNKFTVDYVKVDRCGKLSLSDLENKLIKYKGNVKLLAITGASNVSGYKNKIYEIAELVHKYKAQILVDAAQLVAHSPIDMHDQHSPKHIDFLAFSGHKMYAPLGIGVLIGPRNFFEKGYPSYVGGGTVKLVTRKKVIFDDPPHNEEAGTPNLIGVVGLVSAMQMLKQIGLKNIENYEKKLLTYAEQKLSEVEKIELYCSSQVIDKVSIIPFNIKGLDHSVIAKILSQEAGISVRNGCFCAQPYIHKLLHITKKQLDFYIRKPDNPRPGMVRLSFSLYNDFKEIDILVQLLHSIVRNKEYYIKTYSSV